MERSIRKIKVGRVIKLSGMNTISVLVEALKRHPLYGKVVRRSNKYLVHDPESSAVVGDVVTIMECRPISKNKSWRLVVGGSAQKEAIQ